MPRESDQGDGGQSGDRGHRRHEGPAAACVPRRDDLRGAGDEALGKRLTEMCHDAICQRRSLPQLRAEPFQAIFPGFLRIHRVFSLSKADRKRASARKLLGHGPDGAGGDLRDFRHAITVKKTESDQHPFTLRQPVDKRQQVLLLDPSGLRVSASRRLEWSPFDGRDRRLPPASPIDDLSPSDLENPGPKLRRIGQRGETLKPREQRGLRDVFGGVDVAQLCQRNRQNTPLVAAAQLAKRLHIAASHAVHELRIGKHALGRSHSQAIELLSYQTGAGRALRQRFPSADSRMSAFRPPGEVILYFLRLCDLLFIRFFLESK